MWLQPADLPEIELSRTIGSLCHLSSQFPRGLCTEYFDAGQIARVENPAGFANVRAHAEAHLRAIGLAYAEQSAAPAKPSPSQ